MERMTLNFKRNEKLPLCDKNVENMKNFTLNNTKTKEIFFKD